MKYTYFDTKHFGICLRAAIARKKLSMRAFQRTYFPEMMYMTVYRWTKGLCMPKPEQMQTLIDIFGWRRVRLWLRFTFDTTPKKQIS